MISDHILWMTWMTPLKWTTITWVTSDITNCFAVALYHCSDEKWAPRWLTYPATPLLVQLFVQAFRKKILESALLALCEGNPSVTGGFTSRRIPVMVVVYAHTGIYDYNVITNITHDVGKNIFHTATDDSVPQSIAIPICSELKKKLHIHKSKYTCSLTRYDISFNEIKYLKMP